MQLTIEELESKRLGHILKTNGCGEYFYIIYRNFDIYYNSLKSAKNGRHPFRREYLTTIVIYRKILRKYGRKFSITEVRKILAEKVV